MKNALISQFSLKGYFAKLHIRVNKFDSDF